MKYNLETKVNLFVVQDFHDKDSEVYRNKGEEFETTLGRALYLSLFKHKGISVVEMRSNDVVPKVYKL